MTDLTHSITRTRIRDLADALRKGGFPILAATAFNAPSNRHYFAASGTSRDDSLLLAADLRQIRELEALLLRLDIQVPARRPGTAALLTDSED